MKNCLKRLSASLKTENDYIMYEAAYEYVSQMGEIYANHYIACGESYRDGQPIPPRPVVPISCSKKVDELSPRQKARLISIGMLVDRGGVINEKKTGETPYEYPDSELEFSENVDKALHEALGDLLDQLSESKLDFHSEYAFQKYLRELTTRINHDSYPRLTAAAVLSFLENNFYAYRSSRILYCCLSALVENFSNIPVHCPDREKAKAKGSVYADYLENVVVDKDDWFADFLPQLDGWSLHLGTKIKGLPSGKQSHWRTVFQHAEKAQKPKVNKTFLIKASDILENLPEDLYREMMDEVEDSMGQRGILDLPHKSGMYSSNQLLHQINVPRLRGLLWMSRLHPRPKMAITLERIIDRCFQKIPGVGPFEEMLGQAALDSMVELNHPDKSKALYRLLDKHKKNKNVKKRLTKAIEKVEA